MRRVRREGEEAQQWIRESFQASSRFLLLVMTIYNFAVLFDLTLVPPFGLNCSYAICPFMPSVGPIVIFLAVLIMIFFLIKLLPWSWMAVKFIQFMMLLLLDWFVWLHLHTKHMLLYTFKTITMLQPTIISIIFFLAYSIYVMLL